MVILTDLETFASVLDRAFPPQHDAHVSLYRLTRRNRVSEEFRTDFTAYVATHGFMAAMRDFPG